MTDKLLNAAELAELLNVPVGWVREHTRNGTVPHVRLGRYCRYDRARVLEWLERLEQGGPRFAKHKPKLRR